MFYFLTGRMSVGKTLQEYILTLVVLIGWAWCPREALYSRVRKDYMRSPSLGGNYHMRKCV